MNVRVIDVLKIKFQEQLNIVSTAPTLKEIDCDKKLKDNPLDIVNNCVIKTEIWLILLA